MTSLSLEAQSLDVSLGLETWNQYWTFKYWSFIQFWSLGLLLNGQGKFVMH